jgi:hypothetical protein
MLYDQGLIVETNKTRLFTNFKYTLQEKSTTPETIEKLEVSSYESFNSQCNETMIGMAQNKERPGHLRCFYGVKLE